ncbi:hypothetical protein GCM10020295_52850 [Streptomyces cinereospinus]
MPAPAVKAARERCAASHTSRTGLAVSGGVREVLVDPEAEPAVVGDEAGVALGHAGLDGLEAAGDQLGDRGLRLGELVAGAGEGGGDLLQVDRQDRVAQAERPPQLDEEVQGRQRQLAAVAVPGDGVGVDLPVVQGPDHGREGVPRQAVVAADDVRAVPGGLRYEEPLVGEFGEGLADQEAVGPRPAVGERCATASDRVIRLLLGRP